MSVSYLLFQLRELAGQVGDQFHGGLELLLQVPDLVLLALRIAAHQRHRPHPRKPVQVVLLLEQSQRFTRAPEWAEINLEPQVRNRSFISRSIRLYDRVRTFRVKCSYFVLMTCEQSDPKTNPENQDMVVRQNEEGESVRVRVSRRALFFSLRLVVILFAVYRWRH